MLGLAFGFGVPATVDARKKKKKKKKKKKSSACPAGCRSNEVCRNGMCVDPACGACAPGQQCIYGLCQDPTCNRIEYGGDCPVNQACCQVADAKTNGVLAQPICLRDEDIIGSPYYSCMMPVGSTFKTWPYNIIGEACTTGNVQEDANGLYRCCSGWGDTDYGDPANCCGHRYQGEGHSVNGLCCIASGKSCSGSTLCCNGQTCPGSGVCP
jgi:hypothetical protein